MLWRQSLRAEVDLENSQHRYQKPDQQHRQHHQIWPSYRVPAVCPLQLFSLSTLEGCEVILLLEVNKFDLNLGMGSYWESVFLEASAFAKVVLEFGKVLFSFGFEQMIGLLLLYFRELFPPSISCIHIALGLVAPLNYVAQQFVFVNKAGEDQSGTFSLLRWTLVVSAKHRWGLWSQLLLGFLLFVR